MRTTANEYIIRDKAWFIDYDLTRHIKELRTCAHFAQTTDDRDFWETQRAVLEDVQTAIKERIKPKEGE
ncbi:MAG: hypothetical protein IPP15_15965 [Saprospiraceae bacterium]|uniref:Uncharacterized protein n=1 Tax=Candidatus Opimibacter skivensis TaxID=2982028 RepID=A0A9D7SV83_9BACT|nr:hypothetical protein [Candidatus Opimibacter skivensis]